MALKAAFIFLAPDVDPAQHRGTVVTPAVELTAVAVKDYAEAAKVAKARCARRPLPLARRPSSRRRRPDRLS